MKILNYLIPSFLRRLDMYLLQRYPIIWETKIHYVLFFSAIVANLFLAALSFVPAARELSFMPYDRLILSAWGWGFLFALLAILFYAYQQSFVRIKNYTLRENVLRYGLYILGVSSIMLNTLTLPNLLVYRVNQLYAYAEIEQDLIELYKLKYLEGLIREVYSAGLSEQAQLQHLQLIQKLPLNQNQAYEKMMVFQQEIEAILDLREDKDWRTKIENHPIWHPDLKRKLIDRLQYENNYKEGERARIFGTSADLTLLLAKTQRNVAKYLPEQPHNLAAYYANRDLAFQLSNLMAYKHAGFLLNSFSANGLENQLGLHQMVNTLRRGSIAKNHQLNSYNYEMPAHEGTTDKRAMIQYFASQPKLESIIRQICHKTNIEPTYTFQASAFLTLFLALLVLSAKLFTLRNLIISGFMMFGSLFLLLFVISDEFFMIKGIRLIIIDLFANLLAVFGLSLWHFTQTPLFLSWLIPILIIAVSIGLTSYVQLKKINFRWIPLLWTFVISSAMVSTAVTSFVLLLYPHISGRDAHHFLLTQIYIIYPILALAMFGMYAFYNQITIFPQKK
jgi:hypothetical protein